MTENDSYERFVDDFGRQLEAAANRRAPRRPSHRTALGALALAGATAGGLVLTGTGGGVHLDVVARADAALSPPRGVVYMATTVRLDLVGGLKVTQPPSQTTEQWSTSLPVRWRIAIRVPAHGTGHVLTRYGQTVVGLEQFSYAGGTAKSYTEHANVLDVTTGLRDDEPAATDLTGPLGTDPVRLVRSLLAAGRLHDDGTRVVDGRTVRRLVGTEPRGASPSWPIEYDVDPQTFAPVQVTLEMRMGSARSPVIGTPILVETVDEYQRLPLNQRTAELLTIHPIGKPTVHRRRAGASTRHP